jgi:hypothetical protein
MDFEQPIIWTSMGNMEESLLTQKVVWSDNDHETICQVEHWFEGECVKRACHVYLKEGANVLSQVGEM